MQCVLCIDTAPLSTRSFKTSGSNSKSSHGFDSNLQSMEISFLSLFVMTKFCEFWGIPGLILGCLLYFQSNLISEKSFSDTLAMNKCRTKVLFHKTKVNSWIHRLSREFDIVCFAMRYFQSIGCLRQFA